MRQLDGFNFHHVLADTKGVSLVIFTGPHCGACRQLKQVLAQNAERFVAMNLFEVDAQQDMGLVNEFAVFHLPALFLFRDGHYHCELHSEARPQHLLDAIESALRQAPQEAP